LGDDIRGKRGASIGISGMHYTAMFASQFAPESYCLGGTQPNSHWLAITIAGFALAILAVTMILVFYDAYLETKARQHAVALEEANARLHHQATHDALTGLSNRVLLEDRLSQAIALAERSGTRFATLVMDLDRFKLINDSLGHHAGTSCSRKSRDVCSRSSARATSWRAWVATSSS
jgi:predicted signal transduction protein with EAL and GGDEF domain